MKASLIKLYQNKSSIINLLESGPSAPGKENVGIKIKVPSFYYHLTTKWNFKIGVDMMFS